MRDNVRVQLDGYCKLGIIVHHLNMEVSIYVQITDVGRQEPAKRVLMEFSLAEGVEEIVSLLVHLRMTEVDSFHFVVLGGYVGLAPSLIGNTMMGEMDNIVHGTLQSRVIGCLTNVISEGVGINARSFDGVTPLAKCITLDSVIVCGKFERGMGNWASVRTPQLKLAPIFEVKFGFTNAMPSGDVMQD